ncbi:MAG: universal stress protein [Thermodesulfobacteriota bacterium]
MERSGDGHETEILGMVLPGVLGCGRDEAGAVLYGGDEQEYAVLDTPQGRRLAALAPHWVKVCGRVERQGSHNLLTVRRFTPRAEGPGTAGAADSPGDVRGPVGLPSGSDRERRTVMAEIRKIMCAVDFSEATGIVAGYAALLAKGLGAEVVVLHVAPAMQRYTDIEITDESLRDFEERAKARAESDMRECLEGFFKAVPGATGKVVLGYAPEAIVDEARAEGCGLILMGTHGRTGLSRLLFGSVAERVVKTSPIPVLTVRPE